MIYSNNDTYSPETNRKIYCDLNGNKFEKYASI